MPSFTVVEIMFYFFFIIIMYSLFNSMQVAAGELELTHECNSMNWSPEDFETKLQVKLKPSIFTTRQCIDVFNHGT